MSISLEQYFDVVPFFLRVESAFFGNVNLDAEGACREAEWIYRGADCLRDEAGGDRHAGGGGDPPDGDFEADILPVDEAVRRAGGRKVTAAQAIADETARQRDAVSAAQRPEMYTVDV